MSIAFTSQAHALETVVSVLARHKTDDYYAYERGENWYIGIGSQASLVLDSKGETVTVNTESSQTSRPMDGSSVTDIAREFVSHNMKRGCRIFGQAGFNYAAHIRGQAFTCGNWPLLALLVPRIEILLHQHTVTLKGIRDGEVKGLYESIQHDTGGLGLIRPQNIQPIDTQDIKGDYTDRVERALSDIARGQYTKVIPSRAVEIKYKIDMPATLLAGTRSALGTNEEVENLRHELLNDPKEIVEHVVSVREAITELRQLCQPDTIKVEDLMSIRTRGSVQHLGSRVAGTLSPEKDVWDAFNVLFPSITASGIPKHAAIEAIKYLEDEPRELYSGAVFMIEDLQSFEAALVLRTVFQDQTRGWIQAGAGVISQSNPQRELMETREKLASIAPFVIPDIST
ncbi:unnamed protein product [Penicillium egyptiacum]|uniref:Chorismate-utilising enzyme C-terminal domain-containing protein n=1 Tax=Penicillium egyptiacum TaxID=1303716 RepID=A0A9W4KFH0_9EURO|nr:unnamed protein product [Penicillium egyptiacum]